MKSLILYGPSFIASYSSIYPCTMLLQFPHSYIADCNIKIVVRCIPIDTHLSTLICRIRCTINVLTIDIETNRIPISSKGNDVGLIQASLDGAILPTAQCFVWILWIGRAILGNDHIAAIGGQRGQVIGLFRLISAHYNSRLIPLNNSNRSLKDNIAQGKTCGLWITKQSTFCLSCKMIRSTGETTNGRAISLLIVPSGLIPLVALAVIVHRIRGYQCTTQRAIRVLIALGCGCCGCCCDL